MVISNDFQFSQSSLQDFLDCKRRFYYRYGIDLSWPALEAEPALENEKWMQQGAEFHQIVHQYLLGLPESKLSNLEMGENLQIWWNHFISALPVDLNLCKFPEQPLAAALGEYALLAKFDLVVIDTENHYFIYDWKTSRKPSSLADLESRMQSKVYPYVLAKSGGELINVSGVDPDKIKMIYWYPNNPENPVTFQYSAVQLAEDERYLQSMVFEILSLQNRSDFPKTDDRSQCRFCVYRSLCDRGEKAGQVEDHEVVVNQEVDISFDFDQIPEIEF